MTETLDKFATEAPMLGLLFVMIAIWNPAAIISNINNQWLFLSALHLGESSLGSLA